MIEAAPATLVRLDPEATVVEQDGTVSLVLLQRRSRLWRTGALPDWLLPCLSNAISMDQLLLRAGECGGLVESASVQLGLARLAELRALHLELRAGERLLAALHGAAAALLATTRVSLPGELALSPWTSIRREGDTFVLENPLVQGELLLPGPGGVEREWLTAHPIVPAQVLSVGGEHALSTLELATRAGFFEARGHEERSSVPRYWEFHDLHFHSQSRLVRQRGSGATFRLLGKTAPPPVTKPDPGGERIRLTVPTTNLDMPFYAVLERRRSWREQGERPVGLAELGALLYHGARMRQLQPSRHDDVASFVYPSAGARYPLDIYVCAGRCEGLARGMYRYLADQHELLSVAPDDERVGRLLSDARVGPTPPEVVLSFSARFGRTLWKYEGIGYALILKDVGVLMQTLHLVATALGVGSCILGSGDSYNFCRLVGVDALVEASVGEMVIGGLPDRSGLPA